MRFVGIDPGRNGALVVIGDDGVSVIDHRWWTRQIDPPRALGAVVRPGDMVAIEKAYIGRNPQSAITLSEWIGWLRCLMPRSITLERPTAGEWRAKVFRRSRMTRAVAKQAAIQLCVRHSGLRRELAGRHDLAEAWCMARYAWGWHQKFGEQENTEELIAETA